MKTMKRILSCVAAVCMVLSLASCGAKEAPAASAPAASAPAASAPAASAPAASAPAAAESGWPTEKPITINCGAAGGTVDLRVRTLATYLEKYLDQTIVVVNHDGNDMALNDTLIAAPDGYTFGTLLCPDILAYLNPSSSANAYKPSDFAIACQFLADHVIISVRPDDERFANVNDLNGLLQYLQEHPDENLLAAVSKEGSVHHLAYSALNNAFGTANFIGVNNSGGAAVRKSSFMAGDVDIHFGSIADAAPMIQEGIAKPLAIFAKERSDILPDLATTMEQGFQLDSNHSRGFVCNPDVDPAIVQKFSDTIKAISEDPEYIAELAAVLDEPGYLNSEDYMALLDAEGEGYTAMLKALGQI